MSAFRVVVLDTSEGGREGKFLHTLIVCYCCCGQQSLDNFWFFFLLSNELFIAVIVVVRINKLNVIIVLGRRLSWLGIHVIDNDVGFGLWRCICTLFENFCLPKRRVVK